MARDDFRLLHRERVRWGEADMQGVVFNAHYLTYIDVGVTEYFRALSEAAGGGGEGLDGNLPVGGGDFFLARTELDYHAPAEFDDMLEIGMRIKRFGRTSVEWVGEIHRGGDHLMTARMVYVHADVETKSSKPLPDAFKQLVAAFERVPPEGA
ncbi:acyl-CoA thioesterase [Aquisalimonas asiatica]|uniref:Acyl-CoA thioester hydrolase n=1 Tax=Aquisalimonas asiatica TaxID=406100 RepID=A0A1H8SSI8_9GAMM|nr:thioesterase family protein [Aquisalimonas asiatica]SEO81318.1 acyl-CoA thioester hydrolase [Aquisalimonas asiatica]